VTVMQEPKHPYTQLLLQSIPSPDPDERWGKSVIAASEQDDTNVALRQSRNRCLFAERCPYVMETCWRVRPALFDAHPQRAACFLHDPAVQSSGEARAAVERVRAAALA
ncbi:MAG: hypothetical protein M3121_02845, partial [Chloroflexota bacterium]|nr:hypothetical protein [Chloroflexota bacterium]